MSKEKIGRNRLSINIVYHTCSIGSYHPELPRLFWHVIITVSFDVPEYLKSETIDFPDLKGLEANILDTF